MDALKLTALDEDDLQVISTHLQDAVVLVADMAHLPAAQRFVMVMNRFDWQGGAGEGEYHRRRTGVHFNRVRAVRGRNIEQSAQASVLELLQIQFTGDDPPSGRITLIFSGGGEIELDVECIEVAMTDLGPVWTTKSRPRHNDD